MKKTNGAAQGGTKKGAAAAAEEGADEDQGKEGQEGQEGSENADENEGGESETIKAERKKLADEREEFEAEKARLAREKESQAGSGKPKVTSTQLRAMGDKEREYVEAQTGMTFDKVLANIEAQEYQNDQNERLTTKAKLAVREAIDDAIERNPQLGKMKAAIREYLDDVPDHVKADPVLLKARMEKAVTYAKGKNPAPAAKRDRGAASGNREDRPDGDDADEGQDKKNEIKPGTYAFGDMKIEIQNLVPKEQREKMKHPDKENAVRIAHDFDAPPRFR